MPLRVDCFECSGEAGLQRGLRKARRKRLFHGGSVVLNFSEPLKQAAVLMEGERVFSS